MGKYSNNYLKIISEVEYREVGKNETPLTTFTVVENYGYKNNKGKWVTTGKTFWDCQVWGDMAAEAALLDEGDVIDVSAEIRDGKHGEYVSHRAVTDDGSYENKKGQTVQKVILKIFDWDVREFENDDE